MRPFIPTALGLVLATSLAAQRPERSPADPARAFFAGLPVVRVQLTFDDTSRQLLREKPREYAPARLVLDDTTFVKVGVKLKGAAGSFRDFDDTPGFTIHLGKFGGEERFHGLQRFHLNNGAQDESRLCEWLGHEVFTAAKYPAPRVGHAIVRIDERAPRLYVLRESYDRQFLRRVLGDDLHGNLYDGGFCQDVDAELEKDGGDGPDDRADLQALCELCRGVDQRRAERLAAAVDIAAFLDFVALEAMVGHWDGYSRNANNFRLWLPKGGPALFFPHGMDQIFGDGEASILDHPPAIVASAVLQQPGFRKRYRERVKALVPLFAPERLRPRLETAAAAIQRALKPVDAEAARAHGDAVRDLLERVEARHKSLAEQAKAPEPKPLVLARGKPLLLKTWHPGAETSGINLERKTTPQGQAYQLEVKGKGEEPRRGSYHTHVLLGPGRYELRATVRCTGVVPPPKDEEGNEHGGITLRAGDGVSERLTGDVAWRALSCAFTVEQFQQNVELRCDYHAFVGKAWFRVDSLVLVRVGD
ncbi:MAG: CotH kinase family protein [Planctomycetes bacterium]|nr:CotH kinase family protein [Planctomycetota bacterium]